MQYQFISSSIDDTIRFGHTLSKVCSGQNLIILLNGDLGTGKTTLVHGLASGLGITSNVTSPSFNLLNIYTGPQYTLYHIDAYRDKNISWESLMLDDIVNEPFCCIIEWSENFFEIPQSTNILQISIKLLNNERYFTLDVSSINMSFLLLECFKTSDLSLVLI